MDALEIVIIVGAYVLGTFPSANLVGRLVGHDPTREGSRNPGATNMYRIAGRNAGAIVLAADFLKGAFATWLGLTAGSRSVGLAAAVAVVIGHIFPIGRRFHGGKGVATLAGATMVLWPLLAAIALAIWLVVVKATKISAVGALVAVPALAVGVMISGRGWGESLVAIGLAALVIVRHRTNIKGLLSGSDADSDTTAAHAP